MKKPFVPILVSALLFFPIGYIVGNNADSSSDKSSKTASKQDHEHPEGTPEDHDHDEHGNFKESHDKSHSSHSHGMFDASDLTDKPMISNLTVEEDAKSGWNLSFDVENFTFTPDNVNEDHVDNEGHAHIEVNGEKFARIYSNSFHIEADDLAQDTSSIVVTLNTNEHDVYMIDGEAVEAQAQVFNQ